MSHPRVSPDEKWITFTRYNRKKSGLAQEVDGYEETEIMLMRIDGSDVSTLVPPKPGILNCNSSWAEGGKSLLYVSTDNEARTPWIMKMDFESRKSSRIPTPETLKTTDPHNVGDYIVFPVLEKVDSLWMCKLDGSNLHQITFPKDPGGFRWFALPVGDYDPKISPDGKRVAYMRLHDKNDWKIFVVDLETHVEQDLSQNEIFDIVPDWSSDGKLIIFPHIDVKDFSKLGMYTMKPDGTERRMIPLPRGYLGNQPHFFPRDGSGSNARFVYQSVRTPGLF